MVDCQVAVRQKESMNETLFMQTVLIINLFYPYLTPCFKWEEKNFSDDPIFIQFDSKSGRG